MLQRAITHKYDLGHVTNKIHLHLQKMYRHHLRKGPDLVLEAPKHEPLIK